MYGQVLSELKNMPQSSPKSNQRKPSVPKNALTLSLTCAGKLFGGE